MASGDRMLIYRVEISIDAEIEADWLDWIQRVHVPDVVRTGCFSACRIYKVIDAAETGPVYVMQYDCRSLEEYHRYRDNFALPCRRNTPIALPGVFGARASFSRKSPPRRTPRIVRPTRNYSPLGGGCFRR